MSNTGKYGVAKKIISTSKKVFSTFDMPKSIIHNDEFELPINVYNNRDYNVKIDV
jgi:uncharacterized protein YfaS (alpha-2-macroglobulin family)